MRFKPLSGSLIGVFNHGESHVALRCGVCVCVLYVWPLEEQIEAGLVSDPESGEMKGTDKQLPKERTRVSLCVRLLLCGF